MRLFETTFRCVICVALELKMAPQYLIVSLSFTDGFLVRLYINVLFGLNQRQCLWPISAANDCIGDILLPEL